MFRDDEVAFGPLQAAYHRWHGDCNHNPSDRNLDEAKDMTLGTEIKFLHESIKATDGESAQQ